MYPDYLALSAVERMLYYTDRYRNDETTSNFWDYLCDTLSVLDELSFKNLELSSKEIEV